jgi:hypothetical protein
VCVLCAFILCLSRVEAGNEVKEDLSVDKPVQVIYRITAN